MKRILLSALFAVGLLVPGAVVAQSGCPTIVYGAVLTAAQWNACFAAKQNSLGYTPVNKAGDTMLGKLVTITATTATAGLNLPQGAAPTIPVNGDLWTTLNGVYARINGATVGPFVDTTTGAVASFSAGSTGFTPSSATTGAVSLAGTLNVGHGGTGITSGTSGGIPYFSSSSTVASSAALTASQIVLGGGAGATPASLGSLGTTTTVLHGNAAGAPTFGAVSLTADISGILVGANGGTGVANTGKTITLGASLTTTGAGAPTFAFSGTGRAFTFPDAAATLAAINVAQTWTAVQTYTNSDLVLLGSSTGATTFTSDNSGASNFTLHVPAANDTLAALAASQAFTNKTYNGNTWTAGTGTLTIAAGKTLTANNSIALTGTDSTVMTFPTTTATIARTDAGQTFTGTQAFGAITYTTLNGNTWGTGTGTLSIGAGKTFTASNTLTMTGTDGNSFAFPSGSDTVVVLTASQTLTNKTISGSSNTLTNIGNSSLTNPSTTVNGVTCTLGSSCTPPANGYAATYLVVGGGGAGGDQRGGGGGAGQALSGNVTITVGRVYSMIVGAGSTTTGAGGQLGKPGGTSLFDNISQAIGGGTGGLGICHAVGTDYIWCFGQPGGNGGGGGGDDNFGKPGGNPIAYGFAGGYGTASNVSGNYPGGGGGGMGAVGQSAPSGSTAGAGGTGISNSITGAGVTYACGGGGGSLSGGTAGAAGCSSAGAGANSGNGSAATANFGGGGGGAGNGAFGGAGGSGVVILSVPTANYTGTTTGSPTITTSGGNTIIKCTTGTCTYTGANVIDLPESIRRMDPANDNSLRMAG